MDKLIINAVSTGMVPSKRDNLDLPIGTDEIIAKIRRCMDANASIVHARAESGQPTYKKEIYAKIYIAARSLAI